MTSSTPTRAPARALAPAGAPARAAAPAARLASAAALGLALLAPTAPATAGDDLQVPELPGTVLQALRLTDSEGGFLGLLDADDRFGHAVTSLGDLDGNGVADLAVGAPGDDDGGGGRGAVWILFLEADGTVANQQKISATDGGFTGDLGNNDGFGTAVAGLGDLNQDGVPDLAVGSPADDDLCCEDGAVWILFLAPDGTVASHKKITPLSQAFTNDIEFFDTFGTSITNLGDLDGDGHVDLAVGAPTDDDSSGGFASDTGTVWILFMRPVGTVKTQRKLSDTTGDFIGIGLGSGSRAGHAVGAAGDLDGDGLPDLLLGVEVHGFSNHNGRVFPLRLDDDGSVFTPSSALLTGTVLGNGDHFGAGLAAAGDLDGNGEVDPIVGAPGDDDAAVDAGAVYLVFRDASGAPIVSRKITTGEIGFPTPLDQGEWFGTSVAVLGPVDGPSGTRLAIGAPRAQAGGETVGAVHLVTIQSDTWVDQGHALAGTSGEPVLTATGALSAGGPIAFALGDALPSASSTLVVGFTALASNFKGGVLVPSADILVSLPTSPTGEALLPAIWPLGVPGGVTLYLQWWIVDPGGPKGLAASNGVGALTP